MGLSNEERIQKIYYAVRKLVALCRSLGESTEEYYEGTNPYKKLQTLGEDLWPSLFQDNGNGLFWLLGPSDEVSHEISNPWSIAMYNRIRFAGKETLEEKLERNGKEYVFDPFDGFLDLEGLLETDNRTVYQIYCWIQQYQYAANRYQDELTQKFSKTSRIVSQMMGEIFEVFETKSDSFSSAYLLQEICKKLYGNVTYREEKDLDIVTAFLIKHCVHHDIPHWYKRDARRVERLKAALRWVEKNHTLRDRLHLAIDLGGKSFAQYEHKQKELRKICKDVNLSYEKRVKPILSRHKKEKVENDRASASDFSERKQFNRDHLLED